MKQNKKSVLDVCCGGKCFYFDKAHADVVFADVRHETVDLYKGRTLTIKPDVVADFRALPFSDGEFHVVVFDPPHLRRAGRNGWQAKRYGVLNDKWQELLRQGFVECFRVLAANGVLIFKWNETDIPISRVLELTPYPPLLGNRCGKQSKTHWVIFYKSKKLKP
ncbi:MAG: class I SAM-dependent methyltransferase [Verrucomicrobiales bacterium]|jgi:ubiquinone/menaquinone biosynthesis C-methylase UbiE|nr:class I SAM-dependent methyltransferase [Verrucomicrobiales bacterium]